MKSPLTVAFMPRLIKLWLAPDVYLRTSRICTIFLYVRKKAVVFVVPLSLAAGVASWWPTTTRSNYELLPIWPKILGLLLLLLPIAMYIAKRRRVYLALNLKTLRLSNAT